MAADPNDSGAGQRMANGVTSPTSTRVGPHPSTNPTQRTGRPDGTGGVNAFASGMDDLDGDGSTTYRNGKSVNPTARGGRPDADANAPQRSYARAKSGNENITNVSAGTIRRIG